MKLNPDIDHVFKIIEGLKNNDMMCPCKMDKSLKNICPCEDFYKNDKCVCKLFIK